MHDLESVLAKYDDEKGSLIAILQEAQNLYGYLPKDVMKRVAERRGQKPAKVYGVATFYAQFRLKPPGKHHILLCQGTACHVNGSKAIEKAVAEELGTTEGEPDADGLFIYDNVACLGCCSLSPVMTVDGKAYGSLTLEKAIEVIRRIRAEEKEEAR